MKARTVNIAGRTVGEGHPVFIVAELSANHGQRLDLAKEAIRAAAASGADAIKVQTYTPDTITLNSDAPAFVVRSKNVWSGRTLYDLYKEGMTPWEWHRELQQEAEKVGLVFFSTPFDHTAVEYLEGLHVPCHKVASFELNDLPLIEHVASRGKPVILSTGMASLGEIEAAVRACKAVGNEELIVLRCVSAYPAKPEAMHLESIATLRSFGTVVGLSDHTRDPTVAIASVTLGAAFVEKHFICRRSDGGPDSFFSLEPEEFRQMVGAIRDVERATREPRFGPSEDERTNYGFRRSLFVARAVKAGSVLTCDDVRSVRPSVGLDPRHLPEILGKRATRDLAPATPLAWGDVALEEASSPEATLERACAGDKQERWTTSRADGSPLVTCLAERNAHGDTWALSDFQTPGRNPAPGASRELDLFAEAMRAFEVYARSTGAIRLSARIGRADDSVTFGLKRAGFYHFVTPTAKDAGETRSCERRLVRF